MFLGGSSKTNDSNRPLFIAGSKKYFPTHPKIQMGEGDINVVKRSEARTTKAVPEDEPKNILESSAPPIITAADITDIDADIEPVEDDD